MDALLFIKDKRELAEKIDRVNILRLAEASPKDVEKTMVRWARLAEINLTIED